MINSLTKTFDRHNKYSLALNEEEMKLKVERLLILHQVYNKVL